MKKAWRYWDVTHKHGACAVYQRSDGRYDFLPIQKSKSNQPRYLVVDRDRSLPGMQAEYVYPAHRK